MSVSETTVRNLLDSPAATSVPSATIIDNISRATNFIDSKAESTSPQTQKDDATTAMAVWLTYGSYMEGITQQLGNISEADRTKLDHYRKVAELFIKNISAEPVDLDDPQAALDKMSSIPLDPSVFTLTKTEAYPNG